MNTKDFLKIGIPLGEATRRETDFVAHYVLRGGDTAKLEEEIKAIVAKPALFADDPLRKEFPRAIGNSPPPPRAESVKYRQWGRRTRAPSRDADGERRPATRAVAGALLPDAHVGYGLRSTRSWSRWCHNGERA